MAAELGQIALDRVLAVGVYPTERIQAGPVASRIIEIAKAKLARFDPYDDELAMRAELAERVSSGAIEAAAVDILRPATPTRCIQYEVFRYSRFPATMVNYNTDGLADHFCSHRHCVINMHGSSPSKAVRDSLGWDEMISWLQMSPELRAPTVPGLLLPQPEPLSFSLSARYAKAFQKLSRARQISVIGYSFGAMDDAVSYQMLTQVVRRTKAPLVVVGPDVGDLVYRLRSDIGNDGIFGLRAYWNHLAEAIQIACRVRFHKSCDERVWCGRCVTSAYHLIEDGHLLAPRSRRAVV